MRDGELGSKEGTAALLGFPELVEKMKQAYEKARIATVEESA